MNKYIVDNHKELEALAIEEAAKSLCEKRKVGCVLASTSGSVYCKAHNHSVSGGSCEDSAGHTKKDVIHAEVDALNRLCSMNVPAKSIVLMYVTQPPCMSCMSYIKDKEIMLDIVVHIHVVSTFIKFDGDKLRYDLVPVEWSRGDAEVITVGARKYKPNNWRECDDLGRYVAALERHLEPIKAFIQGSAYTDKNSGKTFAPGDMAMLYDVETGLHHAKHLRTNAGFLLTLTEDLKDNDES